LGRHCPIFVRVIKVLRCACGPVRTKRRCKLYDPGQGRCVGSQGGFKVGSHLAVLSHSSVEELSNSKGLNRSQITREPFTIMNHADRDEALRIVGRAETQIGLSSEHVRKLQRAPIALQIVLGPEANEHSRFRELVTEISGPCCTHFELLVEEHPRLVVQLELKTIRKRRSKMPFHPPSGTSSATITDEDIVIVVSWEETANRGRRVGHSTIQSRSRRGGKRILRGEAERRKQYCVPDSPTSPRRSAENYFLGCTTTW